METGKLYKVMNHWWALYPTQIALEQCGHSTVVQTGVHSTIYNSPEVIAESWTKYWSRALDCEIKCIREGEMFVVLERDKNFSWYVKVLTTNGDVGWLCWLRRSAKKQKECDVFSEVALEDVG